MITGINHLTLATKNLGPSFRFYCDVLGMKPLLKHSKGAYLLAGDFWLCLEEDEETRKGPLQEYTHVAWTVEKGEFESLSEKIKQAGAPMWKENRSEGESLYFLDPDGHKLEIHVGSWQTRLASARENPWGESMEFYRTASSSNDDIFIRRAKTSEATLLSSLAFRSKCFWPYPLDYLIKCVDRLRVSEADILDWPVNVAEKQNDIVGFSALKIVSGEERLDHLWIEPRFIGKGIGRSLFLNTVGQAKALGWQRFRIAADPFALSFYLKMGAKQIGEVQSQIKPDLFLPHLEVSF